MKPLGRRHCKDKSGGKHHIRWKGKYYAWWLDRCLPSKKRARQEDKKQCREVNDEVK